MTNPLASFIPQKMVNGLGIAILALIGFGQVEKQDREEFNPRAEVSIRELDQLQADVRETRRETAVLGQQVMKIDTKLDVLINQGKK